MRGTIRCPGRLPALILLAACLGAGATPGTAAAPRPAGAAQLAGSPEMIRGELVDTRLTRNEQLVHLSLWALQAAPLMIGADMSQLDEWTIDLLTNDEVLAVTTDPLGRAGGRVWSNGHRLDIWARPLADGTMAVGLFNRGVEPHEITARWEDLGLSGGQPVRDLWAQRDLGTFAGGWSVTVPRHGVKLVKIGRPTNG